MRKSVLTKNKVSMLMLAVIVVGFWAGGFQLPLSMNLYSPPAAYMSPSNARVFVYGQVVYENGTFASDVPVRLFATDELLEDIVLTDHEGIFRSLLQFEAGQIISVMIDEQRLSPENHQNFIIYDVEDNTDYWIGTYVMP